jgi:hypothetical protein
VLPGTGVRVGNPVVATGPCAGALVG